MAQSLFPTTTAWREMNPTDPRTQSALDAANRCVRSTVQMVVDRVADRLGHLALSATKIIERDAWLSAQLQLQRNAGTFMQTFAASLQKAIDKALHLSVDDVPHQAATDWQSLSLVNDDEVEGQMFANRISQSIGHACEWELRELAAYMGTLLGSGYADHDHNPFRPDMLGLSVFHSVSACSDEAALRKILATELGQQLAKDMPACYAEMLKGLKASGVLPVSLSVRTSRNAVLGSRDAVPTEQHFDSTQNTSTLGAHSGPIPTGSTGLGMHHGGPYHPDAPGGSSGASGDGLMSLIRRLTFLASQHVELSDHGAWSSAPEYASVGSSGRPLNLIHAHREAIEKVSTGALDHMVIDVVGSLFDQILSDPKVPPQMARQIARLQLPVLRVALNDATFFSSRKHPVRRFVNRIASLACAFDNLDSGAGKDFLEHVRGLVQGIVEGDFDQIGIYTAKLDMLELFIAEQSRATTEASSAAHTVVDGKESDLRVQQRYMQQLQSALTPVSAPAYLKDFLSQIWSQALTLAIRQHGAQSPLELKLRSAACDLVLSVQPKGSAALRKKFVLQLPTLMQTLHEGIALAGWPAAASQHFFSQLLPSHAQSLKQPPITELAYNLLAKQLEGIFNVPIPEFDGVQPEVPVVDHHPGPIEVRFSHEEAQRVGFVQENTVDWSAPVAKMADASASDDFAGTTPMAMDQARATPEAISRLAELDQKLPSVPLEPEEPCAGVGLMEHIQLGFAYQMNVDEQWQKVKLNHISPGRTFFVFGRGKNFTEIVSLTSRMLSRLCESGRFRAFESSYLIERASARARRQLAALSAQSKKSAVNPLH